MFKRLAKKSWKKESGSMMDMMGSIIVFVFMCVAILAYLSYSKACQMKMNIDNVVKEYLYKMEESGQFTNDMKTAMKADLQKLGCTVSDTAFAGTYPTGATQAPYGTQITLHIKITFPNPLYENLGTAKHPKTFSFATIATNQTITYETEKKSVSRW